MSGIIGNAFGTSGNVLGLLSAKQQMIAENLANMNTPGYKRKDVNFAQYLSAGANPLETKLSQKLGPSPMMTEAGGEVSSTEEMMDMQKVQVFYTVATRQMTSVIQQLKQVTQAGR